MRAEDNIAYWNRRALGAGPEDTATHWDLFQKRLELAILSVRLRPDMAVLEPGCGDGYVTEFISERVSHVDGFDPAEEMVRKARKRVEGKRCSLFVKSLPDPSPDGLRAFYDSVVSVRVIINLGSRDAQLRALRWMAGKLRPGGTLLLLEGLAEGRAALSDLRVAAGLKPLPPVPFNMDLSMGWLEEAAGEYFHINDLGGIGVYDFLTRFFYPLLVGEGNVTYNTEFHEKAFKAALLEPLAGEMRRYSRLMCCELVRKGPAK